MFLLANLKFQIIMKQNIENVDKQFRSAQSDTLLAKNAENQTNISNCDHVQLGGQAYYDEKKFFMFTPDDPIVGQVQKFRGLGMAQQMADGTFDFVRKPQLKPKSTLIKKLAHGRASKTKDDAIQLTLKVYRNEGVNISEAIRREALEAADAIREYQLRH